MQGRVRFRCGEMKKAEPPRESRVEGSRPATLAESVYTELTRRIQRGEYAPGKRLPSEYDLARFFHVSRPILRMALNRLRADGLIYSRQGAGSFVARAQAYPGLAFGPPENIADIQRAYELREAIEIKAAELAAVRGNDEVHEQLDKLLRRLRRASTSSINRDHLDFELHLTIAKASNNQYFPTMLLALRDQMAATMRWYGLALHGPVRRLQQTTDEHAAIVNAVLARDPQQAGDLMQTHLRNSRDRLFGGSPLDLRL
jgi:GntR family transcriptional repressor for pyruvate dehydrogenase complex